ncbi:hypothetical protein M569_03545, partial [Genlisea aurea]
STSTFRSSNLNLAKSDSSSKLQKKSEDLFWDSTVAKMDDRATEHLPSMSSLGSSSIDNDFIDPKEAKKNRKKSAKAKSTAAKTTTVAASVDVPVGSSPVDKGKSIRLMQQQNESLPSVPSGPSLGDFVLWKGESVSPPAPAWSIESAKPQKPASLRDILREQEKKSSSPMPVSIQRTATNPSAKAAASSSLPSNVAPVSHSKNKTDDDLFWGPVEQPRQEEKLDFPQLGGQVNFGGKNTPQLKATVGGPLSRQKTSSGKFTGLSLSSSSSAAQSSHGAKMKTSTKYSEAVDFKRWCESECNRLIGSKDTSILEYCLKISRSEAETLLVENLGSVDPNHDFIDKFLNYKDFFPYDVVESAFKNGSDENSSAVPREELQRSSSDHVEGVSQQKAGKRKERKGKK